METFPLSRAQSPAHSRAPGAAGNLRLQHILRALLLSLLSLLSVLLGRRRYLYASACHVEPEWLEDFALPYPQAESPRPIRIRSIHDGTHLVCEHPILWVIGPGPCRGMRPISRRTPLLRPRIARGPPSAAGIPITPRIRAKKP
jgi:hypothetical protein